MNHRLISRVREQEINILYTTTRRQYYRKRMLHSLFWTVAFVMIVACFVVVFHTSIVSFVHWTIYQNPAFALKEIHIDTEGNFTQAQIRAATGLTMGSNIFGYNLAQVQRDVERLPYVGEAQVECRLPGTVIIRITERQPIARLPNVGVASSAKEYYVDRNCLLLEPREGESMQPLPEIIGLRTGEWHAGQKLDQRELIAAVELLKEIELSDLRMRIDLKKLDLDQPLCMKGTTTDGMDIMFRYDAMKEQLDRLSRVLRHDPRRQISSIDLTPISSVPVIYKPEAPAPEAPESDGPALITPNIVLPGTPSHIGFLGRHT